MIPNTTENILNEEFQRCSGRGNILNVNYTEFYCKNKIISKREFQEMEINKTLFDLNRCSTDNLNTDICICPKNLRGINCEFEVPFNCKIKSLLVKNNTQQNYIDLLSNKNTFYYEYLNNPDVYFIDRVNLQNYLNFNVTINCTDKEYFDYNYTITLGDINQKQLHINITDFLNQNLNYTKFDYFVEEKALTVGLPADIYLKFKLFDMSSVLPLITLYYPLVTTQNKLVNKAFSKNKITNKEKGYDLFIMNSDTIRSFICEDFDCDKDQTIEEIIEKNYRDKNFYINFSNNLMSYIKRKNNKSQSDFSISEYNLKDGLKYSKIKGVNYEENLELTKADNKEKIKNFLTGLER